MFVESRPHESAGSEHGSLDVALELLKDFDEIMRIFPGKGMLDYLGDLTPSNDRFVDRNQRSLCGSVCVIFVHRGRLMMLERTRHLHGFPLMLDGRSIPLTRGAPDNPQAAGTLTLTATSDNDFVEVASWKRAGRTAKTVANLSCKRSHRVDVALLSVTSCVEDTQHAAPTSNPLKFYLSGFGSGLRTVRVTSKDSSGSEVDLGVFSGASISGAGTKAALVTYMQGQERVQLSVYPDATAPGTILGTAMFNSPRVGNGNLRVRCQ